MQKIIININDGNEAVEERVFNTDFAIAEISTDEGSTTVIVGGMHTLEIARMIYCLFKNIKRKLSEAYAISEAIELVKEKLGFVDEDDDDETIN